MHYKTSNSNKGNIWFVIGIFLLGIMWIGSEIRFQKYEAYAKEHNCKWQIINEKEICK